MVGGVACCPGSEDAEDDDLLGARDVRKLVGDDLAGPEAEQRESGQRNGGAMLSRAETSRFCLIGGQKEVCLDGGAGLGREGRFSTRRGPPSEFGRSGHCRVQKNPSEQFSLRRERNCGGWHSRPPLPTVPARALARCNGMMSDPVSWSRGFASVAIAARNGDKIWR